MYKLNLERGKLVNFVFRMKTSCDDFVILFFSVLHGWKVNMMLVQQNLREASTELNFLFRGSWLIHFVHQFPGIWWATELDYLMIWWGLLGLGLEGAWSKGSVKEVELYWLMYFTSKVNSPLSTVSRTTVICWANRWPLSMVARLR